MSGAAVASGLSPFITGLVLAAAVAHASWNAIVHDISDKLVAFTLFCTGGGLVAVALVIASPLPRGPSWPYLIASVVTHVGYYVLLMQAYRLGEFSQVYPLARGTSPLVVTVLAAVFVHEVPSALQLVGIVVVSAGLGSLVLVGRRPGRADMPALLAALGTGLTIATYTTIDGIGVRLSGSHWGYTGWLILLESIAIPTIALARRGPALFGQIRPSLAKGLLGGGLSLLAYGLVLWAQTQGALASVAALRESSIIVGAIIGTLIFHERFGRPRIVATVIVVAGIVLLNV